MIAETDFDNTTTGDGTAGIARGKVEKNERVRPRGGGGGGQNFSDHLAKRVITIPCVTYGTSGTHRHRRPGSWLRLEADTGLARRYYIKLHAAGLSSLSNPLPPPLSVPLTALSPVDFLPFLRTHGSYRHHGGIHAHIIHIYIYIYTHHIPIKYIYIYIYQVCIPLCVCV